jgi:acetylornithine aminotransferase
VEAIAANNPSVVAVMVEPILGEGGIYIPDEGYLASLRAICDANNWLLIADEVQSGNARTGKFFAYQHTDIVPDVVTTAKGLGNGMPIGVCLARGEAANLFVPGNHGSTFGGNPMACAAANAVLDVIDAEGLEARALVLGERIQNGLRDALAGRNDIKGVRGAGLMLAVEMHQDIGGFAAKALEQGLLINVTQGNIIRLLPPLTMTDAEADELVSRVVDLIKH